MVQKNRTGLFFILILCWGLLILRYVGGLPYADWPNSDQTIFPLTAIHVMQGKPFPLYFYGQDYMGTFPVILIIILFKVFGISHTWVEMLYALIYSGILVLISAFVIKEIGFISALVFAITFVTFPHVITEIQALNSGTHCFSLFLGLLTGSYFCCFIEHKLKRTKHLFFNNNRITPLVLFILAVVTYWSSKLGFLYFIAIAFTALLSCRKQLEGFRELSDITQKKLSNLKKYFANAPVPGLNYLMQVKKKALILIVIGTLLIFKFNNILHNSVFIWKLYFVHFFSKISFPINYFWGLAPLVGGLIYLASNRVKLWSLLKGDEKRLPFHFIILAVPLLNVFFSLPTKEYLIDLGAKRYFMSLLWLNLLLFPLLFSLIDNKKIKWSTTLLYLFIAIYSWSSASKEEYKKIINISSTINYIKYRHSDFSRLLPHERAAITFLEKNKLFYGYSDYWLAYRISFLTHEKFIISPVVGSVRYKPYEEIVKKMHNPFYLLRTEDAENMRFAKKIRRRKDKNFKEKRFGKLLLFYNQDKFISYES